MALTVVTADFETWWSTTHTLSKMSPIAYVMHPETEIISCAIKIGGKESQVYFGEEAIREAFDHIGETIGWDNVYLIAHNNEGFDAMISAWRFGLKPAFWGCTLAMARPIHAKTAGGSLGALVKHYGIGIKDATALHNTKGKHLKDFTAQEIEAMREYNKSDTDQCYELFKILFTQTPSDELRLIDQTIRMLVDPQFVVDTKLLTDTLKAEKARKLDMLEKLGEMLGVEHANVAEEVATVLGSAPKFSKLLVELGVEIPTKISPTTGKEVPALAKTDEEFIALQEHENPIVAAAACARLGVKSTLLESRIQAFLDASGAVGGRLPIPTKYYGADTTGRRSGWAYNPLNLPRVSGKPSDALRNCLKAPEGYKVVVADLSGIELRMNHFLWKVPSSMALYQADPEKADLYKEFASMLYDIPVAEVSKQQRQVGKVAHLGLGYGAGARTFQKVAKIMGGVDLTEDDSLEVVNKWRAAYSEIAEGWKTCHASLADIMAGNEEPIDPWGICYTCKEGIRSPKGLIRYPDLRRERSEDGKVEWVYGNGRSKARIYAGKITENCIAAGTLVLTDSGWKPIETISGSDKVHDGDMFVRHAGKISKSVQECVNIDGVWMTPDHEVLTNDGWKEASQVQGHFRGSLRYVDRLEPGEEHRARLGLGVSVRLREAVRKARIGCDKGTPTRRDAELRVFHGSADLSKERDARDDEAPSVRRVAQHERSLPPKNAQSMGKLRRAWDHCVRQVVVFVRVILGGHGADVHERTRLGSHGQQRTVLAGELPVGQSPREYDEQAQHAARGFAGASEADRNCQIDALLPASSRASTDSLSRQTQSHEVFDILDAGPQHRFVVLGENGPFIVHNCVQHLARQVICNIALEMQKRYTLRPAVEVYDELVYVVHEDYAQDTLDNLLSVMKIPPTWFPDLVLWAEGDIADTYGAAK